MNAKEIFRALQTGELSAESAEKELEQLMGTASDLSERHKAVDLQEIEPGIVLLTMQDRANKNTFSEELVDGLVQAFETISAGSDYKVVILTGYDSYFASGGTKEGLLAIQEGKVKFTDINIYSLALDCKIPVIAAMQGHGIGAGWAMGMFCDFIAMSRDSYYSSNYMKYGFTPGAGATLIFPEKFGITLAQEILFTGRQFRGSELEAKGVAFPVLPRNEVLPYAIQLAKELAQAPRESLIALKDQMTASIREQLRPTFDKELIMHQRTFVNQPEVRDRIESIFNNDLADTRVKQSPAKESAGHQKSISHDSIAIIGMSGQFPEAKDLDQFWSNIAQGKDCISEIPPTRWSVQDHYHADPKVPGKTYSKWMGLLDDVDKFDPLFFNISPAEAEWMDPQQRLFIENCWHCIEDAGLNPYSLSGSRCGVYVGCVPNDYGQSPDTRRINAQVFTGTSTAILSARISYLLNLKGPCLAIDTACSSSLVAIAEACNSLILGTSDLALAGGVFVMIGPSMHIATSKAGMLSKDGRCFTFDAKANGFVPGEGVGVVLLKRLSDAVRDRDPIYGVIRGWGVNQDGKTNGMTAPSANSQTQLEQDVYKRFDINPETISLIETHGTGTKLGDPIEVEALTEAFRSYTNEKNYCALGSVKSNIGHLLTAAGAAGVMKVLLAFKHRMLPPAVHFHSLNEHISLADSPFYINDRLQSWEASPGIPRRAAVSAFGFSGTNAHIVIDEYLSEDANEARVNMDINPVLFVLSAKSQEQLKRYAESIKGWIEEQESLNLADMAYTMQAGREAMEHRLAFPANSREGLLKVLDGFILGNLPAGAFTAQVNKGKAEAASFESNKDSKAILETWIQKRMLDKIAELWVKGMDLDWDKLYDGHRPRRISMPGYPFARERYWHAKETVIAGAPAHSPVSGIADLPVPQPVLDLSGQHDLRNSEESEGMLSFMVSYFVTILSHVLKITPERIDPDSGFDKFGVDSIVVQQLNEKLEQDFGPVSSALFFTYKSVRALAQYFSEEYGEKVKQLLQPADNGIPQQMEKNVQFRDQENKNDTHTANQDIAIIGIGGQYPQAVNLDEFWKNLEDEMDCIIEIPRERWDYRKYYTQESGNSKKSGGMYCRWGSFLQDIDKFDPSFFNISPLEARFMDPQERLFLQTVASCLEDAGYTRRRLRDNSASDGRSPVGVFAGVTFNNYQLYVLKEFEKGNFAPVNSQIYSIANRVSYIFNLRGPSLSVDTACSSSLYAIHLACESIKRGECEMAIAGGVNLSLHPSKYMALCYGQFAASDGRCRSFGQDGDGYVPGEGVGAVLLKPLNKAKADADHIYGVIKGTAVNHDGKTFGYNVPNPVAQAEVIQQALEAANINPRTISYVEAHGTGTKLGDPVEVSGLSEAFGKYTADKQYCAIGSVKSNIGHLEAAAGVAQLTKVLLQMKYKRLAATLIHSDQLNPKINFENTPFFVQQRLGEWKRPVIRLDGEEREFPRRAGISSFGAGGVNVHMIVEEYDAQPDREDKAEEDNKPAIFVLSAKKEKNLQAYAGLLKEYVNKHAGERGENNKFKNIVYTLQTGRDPMPCRLAFTARGLGEIGSKLDIFLNHGADEESGLYLGNTEANNNRVPESDVESFSADSYPNIQPDKIAELWARGMEVDWEKLYPHSTAHRVPLPTYPFSKESYWVGEIMDQTLNDKDLAVDKELAVIEKTTVQEEQQQSRPDQSVFLSELCMAMEGERLEMVQGYIQEMLAKLLAFNPLDVPELHQGFFDMGMESVMSEQFRTSLEYSLNIDISETALFDYPNIAELSKYVLSLIPVPTLEDPQEYTSAGLEDVANELRDLLAQLDD
ncbi:enoyl-CoA hydratase/isomerase family protein [Paenibacillus sp. HN-1]|uniref:beta-ketoacyl synthase N-terminal-like domain-containing protein n=1 Tax=Paenibacillus TaxID=44249 RepID=UPI001CAA0B78|nr:MULTISPECIES: beta-ketoacyl synthase N-terminal-like domain-containing protein [Paenibacillus]MBY9081325.1 enoyl-CoA hydratase/isomerase family protein [Paenibacillus sp. CGMCC 1.18879]MBY9086490.1 enoyl-CoA hydratase/isomerase family protein [Paenibacillus sinensis]